MASQRSPIESWAFSCGVWLEIAHAAGFVGCLGPNIVSTPRTSHRSALRRFRFLQMRTTVLGFLPSRTRVCQAIDKQLQHRDTYLAEIKECLLLAQGVMKTAHNKHHINLEFVVDERVWLRLHHRFSAYF